MLYVHRMTEHFNKIGRGMKYTSKESNKEVRLFLLRISGELELRG